MADKLRWIAIIGALIPASGQRDQDSLISLPRFCTASGVFWRWGIFCSPLPAPVPVPAHRLRPLQIFFDQATLGMLLYIRRVPQPLPLLLSSRVISGILLPHQYTAGRGSCGRRTRHRIPLSHQNISCPGMTFSTRALARRGCSCFSVHASSFSAPFFYGIFRHLSE
jgi:hypothetical protein